MCIERNEISRNIIFGGMSQLPQNIFAILSVGVLPEHVVYPGGGPGVEEVEQHGDQQQPAHDHGARHHQARRAHLAPDRQGVSSS